MPIHGKNDGCFLQSCNIGCATIGIFIVIVMLAMCAGMGSNGY